MENPILKWSNVAYSVRSGFWLRKKKILEEISFDVPRGSVLGLVGPNGAGKTTSIKLGAGLTRPDCGEVYIDEKPAYTLTARKRIGFLTESQYVYPYLKLREWLRFMGKLSGMSGGTLLQAVEKVLERMDLLDRAEQSMHTLSKGQRQRAGLAQALLHDPDILILDEPLSGLDPYWRRGVQDILHDFQKEGGTILFSSHIMSDVEKLCDSIVLLDTGKVRWKGSLDEMAGQIKSYTVVCTFESGELVEMVPEAREIKKLPADRWQFSLPWEKKTEIINLASQGTLDIESMVPQLQDIEEFLFAKTG